MTVTPDTASCSEMKVATFTQDRSVPWLTKAIVAVGDASWLLPTVPGSPSAEFEGKSTKNLLVWLPSVGIS